MDPLKEALKLLDQSLERLENGVHKVKDRHDMLISLSIKQNHSLEDLTKQKQQTLQELYELRNIIKKELQLEVSKEISTSRAFKKPSISMVDGDDYES